MNDENLIHLTIDGKAVAVPKGTTVYQAAKKLGIDIPIFCYQDRMPPFGACRMCLVQVEKMAKLQTSCTLMVAEGMVVQTQSHEAVEGREGILELLLINHPLDCPICDRGGECPLQDQTFKHGPGKSRFLEDKRRFTKPLPMGPVLMLDRERCIICARCTRFGDLVAGDNALEMKERGFKSEVGSRDGGPVESKFIGNTIKLCPVGALTSQVYRFRARPWDNDATASTCTLCPVGCSMILDARDGEIVRTRSRENKEVNDIWMCDKGWFGYEFVLHENRLKQPLVRKEGKLQPASWEEAFSLIALKMKEGGKIAGFGGNPLTTEECSLFQQLIRKGGKSEHVDHRIGQPIFSKEEEVLPPGMQQAIGECEELDYAFLFGTDLTEEFPVIWLRLKQAINKGAKVYFFGHYAPEMARHLHQIVLHAPGEETHLLHKQKELLQGLQGKKGAFFVGRQYLASQNRSSILKSLIGLAGENIPLNVLEGKGNSMGARWAGMLPGASGLNAIQVIEQAAAQGWDFLYVSGANPARHFPKKMWSQARQKLKFLVVQDLFMNETAQDADVVLPALCYVEKEGTFINIEHRPQKMHPGKTILETLYSDGEIFKAVAAQLGIELEVPLIFEKKVEEPIHANHSTKNLEGTLRAVFAPELFDNGVRMKHDAHLIQLAKKPRVWVHPKEGFKHGEKVLASANGDEILAEIGLDENIAEKTAVFPLGFDDLPVQELGPNLLNGLNITLKKAPYA